MLSNNFEEVMIPLVKANVQNYAEKDSFSYWMILNGMEKFAENMNDMVLDTLGIFVSSVFETYDKEVNSNMENVPQDLVYNGIIDAQVKNDIESVLADASWKWGVKYNSLDPIKHKPDHAVETNYIDDWFDLYLSDGKVDENFLEEKDANMFGYKLMEVSYFVAEYLKTIIEAINDSKDLSEGLRYLLNIVFNEYKDLIQNTIKYGLLY